MSIIDRPSEEQFPAKEAAKRLGISVKLLMKHVRAGSIRYINVAGPGASRVSYRFNEYMLKVFQSKQQKREVPACPSTKPPKAHSTSTISKSNVVAFSALPKPGTKKTLKLSSAT